MTAKGHSRHFVQTTSTSASPSIPDIFRRRSERSKQVDFVSKLEEEQLTRNIRIEAREFLIGSKPRRVLLKLSPTCAPAAFSEPFGLIPADSSTNPRGNFHSRLIEAIASPRPTRRDQGCGHAEYFHDPLRRAWGERKAGTAAGRSTNIEPSKILFGGDGPAFTPSLRLWAQVSNR